jgi:hypothetical protein
MPFLNMSASRATSRVARVWIRRTPMNALYVVHVNGKRLWDTMMAMAMAKFVVTAKAESAVWQVAT